MRTVVPLKRAMSLRRPRLEITDSTVELHAPSTLKQPLVVARHDVVGVWPEPDPSSPKWETALTAVPFWTFYGLAVDRPDFGLMLRQAVEPPPVKKLYWRDLLHPEAKLILFAVEDHHTAVDAFRRAGLRILADPVEQF